MHIHLQNDAAWIKLGSYHRAQSCPGTGRVRRWFTASYEYADMNIQEETVNPEEPGLQDIQHLLRQPKNATITYICLER